MTIKGIVYRIVDIGMRMLQPHELYRAQGIPGLVHHRPGLPRREVFEGKQVARCGNAVPPPFAEALVRPICRKCVLTNRSEPRDEINTQAAGGSEPPDRLPA